MARPTRRTQPYRRGLATKMMGPANTAMMRGAPQGLQNPMDVKRTLAKRMSKIGNPIDYVDGAALGRHLRGGVEFPKVGPQKVPTTMIAPAPRRKRRVKTGSRSDAER